MRKLFLAFLLLNALLVCAQTPEVRKYAARKISSTTPKIDGKLDEPLWNEAWWENHFVQYEPYEGRDPSQTTTFAVCYDDNNLYVAMRMDDNSADSIVQRLTRRDEIDGDVAGIIFDSYGDSRTGFAFAVTAAGVKYDYLISNDGEQEDETWNPIWWAETSRDSLGWYAEMRIPLTQVRFNEADIQQWGFQAARYIFRKDEMSLWQSSTRKKSGFVSQFGKLTDIQGIKPRNTFDVMPYVVARTERFAREPENPFRKNGHKELLEGGLDAKIGITNYLTLDLTVNPDFGQVEADPSEVNLSTFETFFREQRPFFIEGKNILNYGLNFGDGDLADEALFYSRRIGRRPHHTPETSEENYLDIPDFTRILGAAKISGKTRNGWSIGILESVTANEYAYLKGPGVDEKIAVEPMTNYFVGRVQKDFNHGNTYLGGMVTAVNRNLAEEELQFLHKSAYAGGIDFVHKWKDKKWEFDASLYGSRVSGTPEALLKTQESYLRLFQRPDATHVAIDSSRTILAGQGGKLVLAELDGSLKWMAAVAWKSPGLELNDVGYLRQADNIFQVFWLGYRIYEPFSVFRELNVNYNQWTQWNFAGELMQPGMNVNAHSTLKNYWWASAGINFNGETIEASALRGGPALTTPGNLNGWFGVGTNQQKQVTVEMEGFVMQSFVKSFEHNSSFGIELGYRPSKSLKLSVEPEYSNYGTELQYIDQFDQGTDKQYLFGSINRHTVSASIRINLNLTPEISLQYWGQPFIASGKYNDFKCITNSSADDYSDRFRKYLATDISYDENGEFFRIQEQGKPGFTFDQPDFNVKDFLSNLVFRWEYKPGSAFFVVWSQNRESSVNDGSFNLSKDIRHLFDIRGRNIFLVKFSYRLGR